MADKDEDKLHSFILMDDFKTLQGIDDREGKIARFCLETSTYIIEQYCKRQFLRKTQFEYLDFNGDLPLPLCEYPRSKVSAVYALFPVSPSVFIEPEFYKVIPDCGIDIDLPFSLSPSPALKKLRGLQTLKVVYMPGYSVSNVLADLAAACMELAIGEMDLIEMRIIEAVKKLLTSRVNELLGELEFPIPVIEFGQNEGRSVVSTVINVDYLTTASEAAFPLFV